MELDSSIFKKEQIFRKVVLEILPFRKIIVLLAGVLEMRVAFFMIAVFPMHWYPFQLGNHGINFLIQNLVIRLYAIKDYQLITLVISNRSKLFKKSCMDGLS